jgi:hypothetical protein
MSQLDSVGTKVDCRVAIILPVKFVSRGSFAVQLCRVGGE